MKIAIVVGHNSRAQGAVRVTDGRSEFDWNGELAGLIQSHDPDAVRVFRREAGGGYSAEIDRVYRAVDEWGSSTWMSWPRRSIAGRGRRWSGDRRADKGICRWTCPKR